MPANWDDERQRKVHVLEARIAELTTERDTLQTLFDDSQNALEQAKEAELSLRAEIRDEEQSHDAAYSKLNNKLEQTSQAAEKLAECLEKLKLFRTSQYHVMWSEVDAALAQYAARRGK